MKYVKKFEDIKWGSKSWNKKSGTNYLQNIQEAIKKINVHGINFRDNPTTYEIECSSPININVPIDGYVMSYIKISKERLGSMFLILHILFNEDSIFEKILNLKKDNNNGSYLGRNYIHFFIGDQNISERGYTSNWRFSNNRDNNEEDITMKSELRIKHEQLSELSVENIVKLINESIDDIINIDFKEIQRAADIILKDEELKNNKHKEFKDKVEGIADYLIELEDISNSNNKIINKDSVLLIYNIDGIKIKQSDATTAKLVINDKLLEIMNVIKTFKKRVEKEINGIDIQSHFKENQVTIELSMSNPDADDNIYEN